MTVSADSQFTNLSMIWCRTKSVPARLSNSFKAVSKSDVSYGERLTDMKLKEMEWGSWQSSGQLGLRAQRFPFWRGAQATVCLFAPFQSVINSLQHWLIDIQRLSLCGRWRRMVSWGWSTDRTRHWGHGITGPDRFPLTIFRWTVSILSFHSFTGVSAWPN